MALAALCPFSGRTLNPCEPSATTSVTPQSAE